MKTLSHATRFSPVLAVLAVIALSGCGAKFTGTYNLNQQGLSTTQACSQIALSINDSGGQLTGMGQNQCYSEQITGTSSNGQANVTLTVMPAGSAGAYSGGYNGYGYNNYGYSNYGYNNYGYNNYGYAAGGCAYQGLLTISGNSVTGTLMAMNSGCTSGQILITGTKN
jgi:hypothetical protein